MVIRGLGGLVVLAASIRPARAQLPDLASAPADSFIVDIAIPDAPAFDLLEDEPGTVLRPGSVQDFGLMLSGFRTASGSFRLPASLGVEFVPALLTAGPELSKKSYEQQKALYALRMSFGALRDSASDGLSALTLGLRYTVRNEADLRGDASFAAKEQVTPLTTQILEVYQAARDRVGPRAELVLTDAEAAQVAKLRKEIRVRWAKRYWNASGVDFAVALRGDAADSSGADPRLTAYSAWGTYASRVGSWGQLVAGARAGAEREAGASSYTKSLALGVRFNAGSNAYKVYSALDESFRESEQAILRGSLGVEIRLGDWLWGTVAIGLQGDAGHTTTDSKFEFKTAFPRI